MTTGTGTAAPADGPLRRTIGRNVLVLFVLGVVLVGLNWLTHGRHAPVSPGLEPAPRAG